MDMDVADPVFRVSKSVQGTFLFSYGKDKYF